MKTSEKLKDNKRVSKIESIAEDLEKQKKAEKRKSERRTRNKMLRRREREV